MGELRIIGGLWGGRKIHFRNEALPTGRSFPRDKTIKPYAKIRPNARVDINAIDPQDGIAPQNPLIKPHYNSFRPTTDRARTVLFDWLRHLCPPAQISHALDLFCGSGILGIECLSQGVKEVVFVDHHMLRIREIQQNIHQLMKTQEMVLSARYEIEDGLAFIHRCVEHYPLILCDPPYQNTDYTTLLLALYPRLTVDGLLYIESGKKLTIPSCYTELRHKKVGHSFLSLLIPC